MGAWGPQFDENDAAADWLADFGDSPNWPTIAGTLSAALAEAGGYLEVDQGSEALAAAEIVAAALGKGSARLSPDISAWAQQNSADAGELKFAASEAVLAVRDGGELHELWHEGNPDEWLALINDLHSRLS